MNPFHRAGQSAIVILLWLCATTLNAEVRTWTSADGRTLEAELLEVKESSIVVRPTAGWRVAEISLENLSESDQQYVEQLKAQGSEQSPSAKAFPEGGLVWPRAVEAGGDFEVEILEENNSTNVYRYRAGHFVFTSDVKLARKVVADFAEVFEATYEAVRAMPLNWKIEAPRDGYEVRLYEQYDNYLRAGGLQGSGGVYVWNGRRMLVPMESLGVKRSSSGVTLDGTGHGTLVHEITHQVQHDYIAAMPVWMSEGFAEYLEAVPYDRGKFSFDDQEPDAFLKQGGTYSDEFYMTDLEALMTMDSQSWNPALVTNPLAAERQYHSAYLLVYYFAHLDGEGDGRRLGEALRILEGRIDSAGTLLALRRKANETLLGGRSYEELFKEMQRAYRSEGIKLIGS